MQQLKIKEQIRKKVARSGNSGAVWVPKQWLGEEIIVTRLETPKLTLEEQIITILLPYLKEISGIFLYGSYSRNEQTQNSDIDLLIITKNKLKIKNIKNFDITVVQYNNIKEEIQKNPFLFNLIQESTPVMNEVLLIELKKIKLNKIKSKPSINQFIESSKSSLGITKEFIELDKLDSEYIQSDSIIYSIILRLRGIFLIKSLNQNKTFSNKEFKNWVIKKTKLKDYKSIYQIYKDVRDNKKIKKLNIKIEHIELLHNLITNEIENLKW